MAVPKNDKTNPHLTPPKWQVPRDLNPSRAPQACQCNVTKPLETAE